MFIGREGLIPVKLDFDTSKVPVLLKDCFRIWKIPRIIFNNSCDTLQFVLFVLFFLLPLHVSL